MTKQSHKTQSPDNEKEKRLSTILNCVADGVFTVDNRKRITFFNRAAEEITGFTRQEALGQRCSEIFRTQTCDKCCTLEEVQRTQKNIVNRHVRILTRDGRSILVSISAGILLDSAGNMAGGVETFRDLSAEETLRRKIEKSYTFHDIVSRHPSMHELFAILPDVAESGVSVLIEGQSGTGKELFARALHDLSKRSENAFVAVNCSSLPDTLLESELFGYKKGAFTDAKKDKPGRFDIARGGTLFLDEIADISPALQVRLLRVLQEKTYDPLGSTEPVRADARIVAATNKDLLQKVKEGSFREDLYYRLKVLRLELPPLRDRRCDIPLLVDFFRRQLNSETGKNIEGVDDEVMDLLMSYDFPGNIRELQNVMQHAFVLCKNSILGLAHLPRELSEAFSQSSDTIPLSMQDIEKKAITDALLANNNNRAAAARQLKIDPSTLYRKMKRFKIQ